ncbi:hypothetical protein BGY98DRAFT_1020505, partial [Russula aff. rugulosa BPL654]
HLAFQDPDVKYLAQQALESHVRSVHLHHNKAVFKVEALPVEAFAASLLGLAGGPKIRLLSHLPSSGSADDSDERGSDVEDMGTSQLQVEDELPSAKEQGKVTKTSVRTKYERMFERKNRGVLSEHYNKLVDHTSELEASGSDEDFITLKRADNDLPPPQQFPFLSKKMHQNVGNER